MRLHKKIFFFILAGFISFLSFSQTKENTPAQIKKESVPRKKVKKKSRRKKTPQASNKAIEISKKKEDTSSPNKEDVLSADSILAFSKKHLGTKYRYAVCDPKIGFDCSGFVYYVFGHFGKKVPRSSIDYINFGTKINKDSCKKGDVIVFTGTNAANRRAGHVGIVISELGEELRFIHCSSNKKRGGVIISSYKESPYYEKRFLRISRVAEVK
ncbi:MAG: C40 family peptidase [Bacteroidia bacterium]|nr:C40 family peptidase [Bacteroidia bacterium]